MTRILAVDCATVTGWATWDGARLESGIATFDVRRGESAGMRFLKFTRWLLDILDAAGPGLVVYEIAHHRGGAATEVGVGLMTRVQEACAARGIEYVGVHSGTLKKFVLGKAPKRKKGDPKFDRSKAAMIQAVERRWLVVPEDDNEADAIALAMYGKETYA